MGKLEVGTCDCIRAKHEHGNIGMYQRHRCRCAKCKLVKAEQHRRLAKLDSSVSARHAQMHIKGLQRLGATSEQIAVAAGVHAATVNAVAAGRAERIRGSVSEMINNVSMAQISEAARVAPSQLRKAAPLAQAQIRELYALGWNCAALAKAAGLHKESCRIALYEGVATNRIIMRIDQGYRRLRNVAPPMATSHERAAATKAKQLANDNQWDALMTEFAA